jgi:hypothetical protein
MAVVSSPALQPHRKLYNVLDGLPILGGDMDPHGGEHVVFDFVGALELARRLWSLADGVDSSNTKRNTAAGVALRDWEGRFANDFRNSMTAEWNSAVNLAAAMRGDAQRLATLWTQAMLEEAKVRYADHVSRKRKERSLITQVHDVIFGSDEDYGPEPGPFAMPQPPAFAATGWLPEYD